MYLQKFLTILFVLFFAFESLRGQKIFQDENWLKGLETIADWERSLTYRKGFLKKEVEGAKRRVKTVMQFESKDEWEGQYYDIGPIPLGGRYLVWNSEGGYISFYAYHHFLIEFDFGLVTESQGEVKMLTEKKNFARNDQTPGNLVKVKVGESRFLIHEKHLEAFCSAVAGRISRKDRGASEWQKSSDFDKSLIGLPVVPERYKGYIRYPLEAQIVALGKSRLIRHKETSKDRNYDERQYQVTLDIGKAAKLENGTSFFVDDLNEWIEVKKVGLKTSIGVITRDFDDRNNERCPDSNGFRRDGNPCKPIKIGMKARTKGIFERQ